MWDAEWALRRDVEYYESITQEIIDRNVMERVMKGQISPRYMCKP
jgi:hypothetical protein